MGKLFRGIGLLAGGALLVTSACSDVSTCPEQVTLSSAGTTVSVGTEVELTRLPEPLGCPQLVVTSTLVEQPAGSTATLLEANAVVGLRPDLPGIYVVERRFEDQVVQRRVRAIPAGGFQQVLGPVPCDRVAVGAATVVCALLGAKGYALPAQVYHRGDLTPSDPLGVAAHGSPLYGGGRYVLPRGTAFTVAAEGDTGAVTRAAVLSLFGEAPPGPVHAAMSGARALLAATGGRLRVVDAGSPTSPVVTALPLLTDYQVDDVALDAGLAVAVVSPLVPDGTSSLAVFDLSAPAAPPFLAADFPDAAIAFVETRLAAVHAGGLDLYTISPDAPPVQQASNPEAAGSSLATSSSRIAVRNAQGVLLVSSTDLSPQVFIPDANAAQVVLRDNRVYVVSSAQLRVYSLP